MPEHSIAALCQRSRDISLEKGWLNPDGTDPRPFHTVTSLFHSEVSEGFEDIRNNKGLDEIYYEATLADGTKATITSGNLLGKEYIGHPKPCGFPVELADYAIRIAQYYGSAGLGETLAARMRELTESNIVDGAPITDDPEMLMTQLHACTSLAWLATPGATAFGVHVPVQRPAIDLIALAFINLLAFCAKKDIDIWEAIDEKEAYNRTRPARHGGKRC